VANILMRPLDEASRILAEERAKRQMSLDGQAKAKAIVQKKYLREIKTLRALLRSGDKDGLFSGFGSDAEKWGNKVNKAPDDWMWVRAKYGIMGVPYPDGTEYSFPPGAVFPLYREYYDHVHKSMSGEVREVEI